MTATKPIAEWGRDHWSTLMYIETRVVDHRGILERQHMRCCTKRHPQFTHQACRGPIAHDDWDCVDDMVEAGLLEWHGTGIHPVFALTEKGWAMAHALRRFRAAGNSLVEFKVPA